MAKNYQPTMAQIYAHHSIRRFVMTRFFLSRVVPGMEKSKQHYTLQFQDCSPLMLDPPPRPPNSLFEASPCPPCSTMPHNAAQCAAWAATVQAPEAPGRPRERERERELGRGSGADGTGAQNVARRARFLKVFFSRILLFVKKMDFPNETWNLGSDFYDPLACFEATAACKKTSAPWNLRSSTNKDKIWRGQNLAFPRFQQNLG